MMEIRIAVAVFAAFVCCASVHAAEEDRNARLLVAKQILNRPYMLVENKDIILEYSIYNMGQSAARKVVLSDNGLLPEEVTLVQGMTHVGWDIIPAHSNLTHTVVVRPLKFGLLNFSSAEVSYLPSEDAAEPVYGYTSAPGFAEIMPYREYDRRFNAHIMDWAAFSVMTLPSLLIPFSLWWKSKTKYENITKQGKKLK